MSKKNIGDVSALANSYQFSKWVICPRTELCFSHSWKPLPTVILAAAMLWSLGCTSNSSDSTAKSEATSMTVDSANSGEKNAAEAGVVVEAKKGAEIPKPTAAVVEAKVLPESHFERLEKDPAAMKLGASSFKAFCVSCHGQKGEGLVGPNLTDKFWVNGQGTRADIYKVIQVGVPKKGMIAWQNTLPDDKIQALVVFVRSLQGTKPANPKAAEGKAVN